MEEYGLALGGGGARGAAHVGVLKALEEEDLLPSSVAGTSAGSVAAGLLACGMPIRDMEKVVQELEKYGKKLIDLDYLGMMALIPQMFAGVPPSLSGLVKGKRLEQYLCLLTAGCSIENISMKTVIPAADLYTGETFAFTNAAFALPREHVVWKHEGKLCRIIRASCGVPAVFRPVAMENGRLVDGGVTNNLPSELLMAVGEPNVIGVDVGEGYEKPENDGIFETISHSFTIMSTGLKDCMSQGELLLLRPPLPSGAGLFTFSLMGKCMEAGYEYTRKMAPQIRKAIRKSKIRKIRV